MVEVDADILTEVGEAVLLIQVRGSVVSGDDDRGALKTEKVFPILN